MLQENPENFEPIEDDCQDNICPEEIEQPFQIKEETDIEFLDPKEHRFNSKVLSKQTKQNEVMEKAIDYDTLF